MADGAGVKKDPEAYRAVFLSAFPGEDETFDRIAAAMKDGRAFIELSEDGRSFAVLQPVVDLHVWTVGGKMEGILELEASVTAKARDAGFHRMTALPSRDWSGALRNLGWKPEETTPLVKELS